MTRLRLGYNHVGPEMRPVELPETAEAQLRQNLRELMDWRRMTQADLAAKLDKSQPWVSKRMSGGSYFSVNDLDDLGRVFTLAPHELLRPGFGQWDRRMLAIRRSGVERRQGLRTEEDRAYAALARSAAVVDPIAAAEVLISFAERLQALADAVVRRHAANLGLLPPNGAEIDREPRRRDGGANTKKLG